MTRTTTGHTSSMIFTSGLMLMMISGTALAQSQQGTEPVSTADPVIRELPATNILLPQRPNQPGVITTVSSVGVDVRLSDTLATTEMQITVENHGSSAAQARLVLPVPEGASIRTFGIDGIGDEPTARLLPRDEASARYQEIVRSMTDPGLLEFVGNAMIQSSVFPVQPGQSRVITVVYEQTLDAHRGRVEYILPRSSALGDTGTAWSINIDVEHTGAMGPVFSPSHPIVTKPMNAHTLKVGVPMLSEPGPFRLYAVLGDRDEATALLYPDADEASSGYFMFVADAPVIDRDQQKIKREISIVIDRSGSMNGEKIQQARESAKQIVLGMQMSEYVRVIDYADDVRSFSDAAVEITPESIKQLIAYIDGIESRGGTNLHDALLESLDSKPAEGTLAMVLFLTDGLATVGTKDEATIRKDAEATNQWDRRVFTFGVGYDVNAPLLDGLSMDSKGDSTFVLPGEDVEIKVGQVFDKLDGPVMIDTVFGARYTPEISRPTEQRPQLGLVYPSAPGDLFSGSRVVVLGRYTGLLDEPAEMYIADGRRRQTAADDPTNALVSAFSRDEGSRRNAFVARLWAQQRINSLINEIRLAGADGTKPDQELVDEIVRLSLEHGIMTEYTAFLADETMDLSFGFAPEARARAAKSFDEANDQRAGQSGVAQSLNRQNLAAMQAQTAVDDQQDSEGYAFVGSIVQTDGVAASNDYFDADMGRVQIQSVQRGRGSTLYRKGGRWVDAVLGENADQDPDQTIEFDSELYWELVDDLVEQGRQWVLSNRGDVYLMNHGQRVLVKNPQ